VSRTGQVVPRRHGHGPSSTEDREVKEPSQQDQGSKQEATGVGGRAAGGRETIHGARPVHANDETVARWRIDWFRRKLAHPHIVAAERHLHALLRDRRSAVLRPPTSGGRMLALSREAAPLPGCRRL
jgi:hypothetical protein